MPSTAAAAIASAVHAMIEADRSQSKTDDLDDVLVLSEPVKTVNSGVIFFRYCFRHDFR